ncbi:MAG: carboxypeptidase regulatory-like domain-containing protein [Acidobacteria bacterium]|nr:carboxypeptidase regulatory-like domain-containing protein [Acidobacteriota bacterium]
MMCRWAALVVLCQALLVAAALQGVVKDPGGAVVAGAIVELRTQGAVALAAKSDGAGRFAFSSLAAGAYEIRVQQSGFETFTKSIAVAEAGTSSLEITLAIAELQQELEVSAKTAQYVNADPNYRKLRAAEMVETFRVENLVITRDVGVLTLRQGAISFAAPVLGKVTLAVFAGEGRFTLEPSVMPERTYLKSLTDKETIEEPFTQAVFVFTDDSYSQMRRELRAPAAEPKAREILKDFRDRMRKRRETPRSMLESILHGGDVDNLEGEVLTDLYNPKAPGFFSAYLHGRKYGDLRFHAKPRGAMPDLPSPEEVCVQNLDPQANAEGIWYLSHYLKEWAQRTANPHEDKRTVQALKYTIETVIGRNDHLTSTARVEFRAVTEGDRVIRFGLLPNLRVSRVSMGGERELGFLQQGRKEDGAFYALMPEPMARGSTHALLIEYQGDKVVHKAGGGNFSVQARTSWYPSLNAFQDQAKYDLTFKVPKQHTLVSVGKPDKEWREDNFACSRWVSETPLAVAGFNYGQFKKKAITDDKLGYEIEGYATSDVPDYLQGAKEIGGMSPQRLNEQAISQARAAMQIFSHWFGPAPYGRIAITQQPEFNFGQSWPGLVYLPLSAYLDSTQRWQLMGIQQRFTEFIQEVTPHEVSHQWWGHLVGWATYRDQWISEGFADFSAGLFLQATESKPDKYLHYWDRARELILEKNAFGRRASDAGPLWLGLRLMSARNAQAYQRLVYPKGGYVLHMLRQMMWDPKTLDETFIQMMRDFVRLHAHKPASSETFLAVVDKHMKPHMDLEGNSRMDWFFRQWVFGAEIPRYKFDYKIADAADGKVLVTAQIAQSEVGDGFRMLVPVYAEFDGKPIFLGRVRIQGNSTLPDIKITLPKKPKRVLINANYDVLAAK